MPRIGIRELKTHASEIVRTLREERAQYIITHHGRPVGVLSPIDEAQLDTLLVQAAKPLEQAELDELSQEIARRWKTDKSAVELLSETRE